HRKFRPDIIGVRGPGFPVDMEPDGSNYYLTQFVREELEEAQCALEEKDIVAFADALADICYVAARAAVICGIDLGPVHDEVHAANLRKTGGACREDRKILKPPGWVPPDVAGVLARQDPLSREEPEPKCEEWKLDIPPTYFWYGKGTTGRTDIRSDWRGP